MQEDIVRVFERFCDSKEPKLAFDYGDIYHLNLFLNKTEEEKQEGETPIYFLQETVIRDAVISRSGNALEGWSYTGAFSILKESTLDQIYFREHNENRSDEASKYKNNIEPFLPYTQALARELLCAEFEIQMWSVIDNINFLNENRDGVLVKFKLLKRD